MIRLAPDFIDLVLNGSVDITNRDMLKLTEYELFCINDKLPFELRKDQAFVTSLPIERGVSNAKLNNIQVGMIKHLMHSFSALTIEHYTSLNRMFLSRVRNGIYAKGIPSIPCTLKQFIDSVNEASEVSNIGYKFTLQGVIKLLHKYDVSIQDIAKELNIKPSVVAKIVLKDNWYIFISPIDKGNTSSL